MPTAFDPEPHFREMAALYRADEDECLARLIPAVALESSAQARAVARAKVWIEEIRRMHRPAAGVTDLLARFGLSSEEGLALMCLAEALLRIPDRATADALIRDKLGPAHWDEALGKDTPWVINAAGWALAITGNIVRAEDPARHSPGAALGRLVARLGQPLIREALKTAMQWLANQFVMGQTIENALKRAAPHMATGVRYSFDMLGEGARTAGDAERFYKDYLRAIDAVGDFQDAHKFPRASGISVKLSALHPRYEMAQRDRVLQEMVPRLAALCERAAQRNIPLTIDGEEADRLQLSLEIVTELFARSGPNAWEGFGVMLQSYQKRAPAVIDYLADLARAHKRKIVIRLAKGAYWDTEIKRAQERGWDDFPVYTRKAGTDTSYLACARRIFAAQDVIIPLFGTHNAMTAAQIAELAPRPDCFEFQHLHGMGEELHALTQKEGFTRGVYAPVGDHDVLLGYLVRRILENGANSSFVHRVYDRSVPIADLTGDPVAALAASASRRHPAIRRAPDLFMPERRNSAGLDLCDPFVTEPLLAEIEKHKNEKHSAAHFVGGDEFDPASAGNNIVEAAFAATCKGFETWPNEPVEKRATCLERLGDLLELHRAELMALLIEEGGKTIPDALGEVREAVDFCRYYAWRAREDFKLADLPGPTGERNQMRLVGRGVFVCISPWNFPLAIFLGQITAALAAGNSVIAKPAHQTPLIAACAARLIYKAGIPGNVFSLVQGGPDIGAALVAHKNVAGVAFTGSTTAARAINLSLAGKDGPIVPLIAETGGQNALIVDSSALPEQVIDDVLTSAFRSAGQRCSALRILCLPEPAAEKILHLLTGAMRELRVGYPGLLETDVGPVIDKAAQQKLLAHVDRLKREAKEIFTVPLPPARREGTFIAPQAWEIPAVGWLTGEVFGPILHVVRYRPEKLDALIADINATGFGLTGGVHSRLESTVRWVERGLRAGNFYVNRSLIGAVVGSQPFGGEGLSGTGPKAGGPHYLPRFAVERVTSTNTTAAGGNASLLMETSEA